MMDDLKQYRLDTGYIVSSSKSIPESNEKGDNPPHAIAKEEYLKIIDNDLLCTHNEASKDAEPIVFEKIDGGLILNGEQIEETSSKNLDDTVSDARGAVVPPTNTAGFGVV